MKQAPTLADGLIREWLKPKYRTIDRKSFVPTKIAQARKFVLDDKMSAFMADLAYASLLTCENDYAAQMLMDSMRVQARLPYPLTFIEYNMHAKQTRAKERYNRGVKTEDVPDRCGWLLMQHPQLDTAFMALECASHAWHEDGRAEIPQPTHIAWAWRCDDGPPPWPHHPLVPREYSVGINAEDARGPIPTGEHCAVEGVLTGVQTYKSDSVAVVEAPHLVPEFVKYMINRTKGRFHPVAEFSSDLRYLWALLATINDLPVEITEVRPSKGYVARGSWRRFSEHKVITLTVPVSRYKRVAAQAIAITRRRAHRVRAHFRIDRFRPPSPLCDHVWQSIDEKHIECRQCHGRKIHIPIHDRGDARLGHVLHDYEVTAEAP